MARVLRTIREFVCPNPKVCDKTQCLNSDSNIAFEFDAFVGALVDFDFECAARLWNLHPWLQSDTMARDILKEFYVWRLLSEGRIDEAKEQTPRRFVYIDHIASTLLRETTRTEEDALALLEFFQPWLLTSFTAPEHTLLACLKEAGRIKSVRFFLQHCVSYTSAAIWDIVKVLFSHKNLRVEMIEVLENLLEEAPKNWTAMNYLFHNKGVSDEVFLQCVDWFVTNTSMTERVDFNVDAFCGQICPYNHLAFSTACRLGVRFFPAEMQKLMTHTGPWPVSEQNIVDLDAALDDATRYRETKWIKHLLRLKDQGTESDKSERPMKHFDFDALFPPPPQNNEGQVTVNQSRGKRQKTCASDWQPCGCSLPRS